MGILGDFLNKDVGSLVKDAGKVLNADVGSIAKGAGKVLNADVGSIAKGAGKVLNADMGDLAKGAGKVLTMDLGDLLRGVNDSTTTIDPSTPPQTGSPPQPAAADAPRAPANGPATGTGAMPPAPAPAANSAAPAAAAPAAQPAPAAPKAAAAPKKPGETVKFTQELVLRSKRTMPVGTDLKTLLPWSVGGFERSHSTPTGELASDPVAAIYSSGAERVQVQLTMCWDADEALQLVADLKGQMGEKARATADPSWVIGMTEQGVALIWTRDCFCYTATSARGSVSLANFLADFPY
jgi:hypothetical protein